MNFHLSAISANSKTGPIAVSTSHAGTCPPNCKLASGGCYAKSSHLGIHWAAVNNGKRGSSWNDFLLQVKALPKGRLFRHNQAGDLPQEKPNRLDSQACYELAAASKRIIGFTYTHYPVFANDEANPDDVINALHNRAVIQAMNKQGFAVNLSADNPAQADTMKSLGIAPVVTMLDEDAPKVSFTPEGNKIVTCPATYRNDINCDTCRICADNSSKRAIIGFPVHGTSKKKAKLIMMKQV